MNVSELVGKKVFDSDAIELGKVADVGVNTASWTVEHLVIKTGLVKKVTIEADKVAKIGDEVFLSIPKSEL